MNKNIAMFLPVVAAFLAITLTYDEFLSTIYIVKSVVVFLLLGTSAFMIYKEYKKSKKEEK